MRKVAKLRTNDGLLRQGTERLSPEHVQTALIAQNIGIPNGENKKDSPVGLAHAAKF